MGALILETTFLIALEREIRRDIRNGPAQRLLEERSRDALLITFTIAGELAAGQSLADRGRWEEFIAAFRVLPATREVEWRYGVTYRYLKENGLLIGTNDLWIAVTALANDLPLVTRNRKHFQRVPGLSVVGYGD